MTTRAGDAEPGAPAFAPAPLARPLASAAGAAVRWRAVAIVGGKGIGLARTLVMARLLAPVDFGLFAIAIVPLDLLLGVTDVGMTPALVQRAEVSDQHYHVAWTVGIARGLAVGALLAAGAPLLAAAVGEPRATDLVRALALRPVLAALASARVAALERELRYRSLALIDLSAVAVATVLSLALAPSRGVWALVIGNLGGAAAGAVASYVLAPHRPRLAFDRARAGALLRFGRWVLAGGMVAMLGESLLSAAIARSLGTEALGRYALAASLASAPAAAAGAAVGAVAFSVHARVQADARQAALVYRTTLAALAAVLLPTYAVLVALAPALVEHVLGPRWRGTAAAVRLLTLVGVFGLVADATVPLLQGHGRPRAAAALYALFAVVAVALVWPLARFGGLAGAALARAVAELAVCGACLALARRVLPNPFRGLTRPAVAVAVGAALAAAAARLVARVLVPSALPGAAGVVVAGVVGGAAGAAALWLLDRRLELGLARDLARLLPAALGRRREVPAP